MKVVIYNTNAESYMYLEPYAYGSRWYAQLVQKHGVTEEVKTNLDVDEFDKLLEGLIKLRMLHNALNSPTNL